MSYDAWPSPEARRGPLPQIEDLPVAEQGYDQEAVRRAFDDFYRHAAQLDASLRALEAVEGFQRTAAELRNDLRTLRALDLGGGWAGSGGSPYSWEDERARPEVPTAALRVAGEAAVIVAVGVIAGVTHLRAWQIVALMGAALLVVWLSEWLAARARTRVPGAIYDQLYEPAASAGELGAGGPAPQVEAPALEAGVGWSGFEHPLDEDEPVAGDDEARPEELTMVEQAPVEPPEDTEEDVTPSAGEPEAEAEHQGQHQAEPAEQPVDHQPEADADAEPAAEHEPRRGWLRRRRRRSEPELEQAHDASEQSETAPASESSGHVRVLAAGEAHEEAWERGFDGE